LKIFLKMRNRLILSFSLIVLVSITSFVLLMRQTAEREVGDFMFRGGMIGAEEVVIALENYYRLNGSWDGVATLFQTHGHRAGPSRIGGQGMMAHRLRLADLDGRLVYDTLNPNSHGVLSGEELARSILLKNGRTRIGYLLSEGGVAFSQSDQANLLERLTRAALTAGVIGGSLSIILAVLLSYSLDKPIRSLVIGARRLASGDLATRAPVSQNSELADLGVAFNQMAEALQQVEEDRKAMTTDIAHELRTPLAVQRAYLEALQDGVYSLTAENLEPVLAQNVLLTRLVEDLRTIALAEAGRLELNLESIDISDLIENVVARFSPQARTNQIQLSFHKPGEKSLSIQADPIRLEQILNNLLSNAIRHTPVGGSIEVTVKIEKEAKYQWVKVAVHDSGQGIPADALPYVFDRFYRADKGRSRETGGTGLGLAIARQLARAHKGDLSAANYLEGGAVFELSIPLNRTEVEKKSG
jgi:signal transduction histidine kinase